MKKTFCYPVVFDYAEDGINVFFSDFEEAYTWAHTTEDALKNAKEVLILTLKGRIEDNIEIPKPTDLKDISVEKSQYTSLVEVTFDTKILYDKKTLTIPHDLNEAATKAGINFSFVLQKAIAEELEKFSE